MTTKVFIILDEHKLDTVKDNEQTLCFETKADANNYASQTLELWNIIKVKFDHAFINHVPNIKVQF